MFFISHVLYLYFFVKGYWSSSLIFLLFFFELSWFFFKVICYEVSWKAHLNVSEYYIIILYRFITFLYMLWSLPGNKPSPRWFDPFHQFVSLSSIIITTRSITNITDVIDINKNQEYFAMRSQFLSASYHCQTLQT